MRVGIVDYGMGNLLSVRNAFVMAGAAPCLCTKPEELLDADRIVLPGVGAFRDCMANLRCRGLVEALEENVRARGKPTLGICLGMQAMARRSFEGGEFEGLGWLDADVVRLEPGDPRLRVPQIGWNEVRFRPDSPLFQGQRAPVDFYFVHSYHLRCDDAACVEATCDYGVPVTAAVRRDNVFATQFHPEKSQENGLRLLQQFLAWQP